MNRYYGDSTFADFPKGIKVTSFTEYGQKQAELSADYACEVNGSKYKATKNVVIIDVIKGDTLRTEEIEWNQLTRTVLSNKLVKQTKADGSVNYGDGFTADDRFTRYTIIHPRGNWPDMISKLKVAAVTLTATFLMPPRCGRLRAGAR